MPSHNQTRSTSITEWRKSSLKSTGHKNISVEAAELKSSGTVPDNKDNKSSRIVQNGKEVESQGILRNVRNGKDDEQSTVKSRPMSRSKSQMTVYSSRSDARRSPSPGQEASSCSGGVPSAMEALQDIDSYYRLLNQKHAREIKQMKKETKLQQQRILTLEHQRRDLINRLDEAERAKNVGVSKQTDLENKVKDLEKRNAELEADIRLITKQYDELSTKHSELQRKDKTNESNLNKAQKKIEQLQAASKERDNRREERLKRKISDDEKLLHAREQEIEELKLELSLVQRKSIHIRDGLGSAKRRDLIRE